MLLYSLLKIEKGELQNLGNYFNNKDNPEEKLKHSNQAQELIAYLIILIKGIIKKRL